LRRRYASTILHGTIFQKTVMFILAGVRTSEVHTSKTSIYVSQTTQRYVLDFCLLKESFGTTEKLAVIKKIIFSLTLSEGRTDA
jgi:hypothetical protein